MTWLNLTILSYFLLSLNSLVERYLLVGPMPNPKIYTFNIGMLSFLASLFFLPFGVKLVGINVIILGLITGLIRIVAMLFLAKGIFEGETSRVTPAVGGLTPIFSFILFFFFFPGTTFGYYQIIAFVLLLIGSVLISLEKSSFQSFSIKKLRYPIVAAFLYALTFFLTKNLFNQTNFTTGLFLILIGGTLGALFFLFSNEVRKEIFKQKIVQKSSLLFVSGQIFGALAVLLQYYAVFIAKPSQVPIINALQGTNFVFLLIFIYLLASYKPELLKENVSKSILIQKVVAVVLIVSGLIFLYL